MLEAAPQLGDYSEALSTGFVVVVLTYKSDYDLLIVVNKPGRQRQAWRPGPPAPGGRTRARAQRRRSW